jgi:hypothetical protein
MIHEPYAARVASPPPAGLWAQWDPFGFLAPGVARRQEANG